VARTLLIQAKMKCIEK